MEKKFGLQIIGLVILIFGGLALTFNPGVLSSLGLPNIAPRLTNPTSQTRIAIVDPNVTQSTPSAKVVYRVELANTPETRKVGLGGRESLEVDSGMLFIFDQPGKPSFWMKGMKIPIDIIWVRDNVIVDLLPNVQPPQQGQSDSTLTLYAPVREVDRVLEVNSGNIAMYGIRVGDRLQSTQQ